MGKGYVSRKPQKNKPWDKLESETSKAFHAFNCYLQLSPKDRTTKKAYNIYSGRQEAEYGRIPGYFNKWSRANNWTARAEEYDSETLTDRLAKVDRKRDEIAILAHEIVIEGLLGVKGDLKNATPIQRDFAVKLAIKALKDLGLVATKIENTGTGGEKETFGLEIVLDSKELKKIGKG